MSEQDKYAIDAPKLTPMPVDPTGLVIVLGPMGLVIGNLAYATDEFLQINAPRIIQAEPTKSGRVSVLLHELLGKPREMSIQRTSFWKVEDPELRKLYLEATTGLTLVH